MLKNLFWNDSLCSPYSKNTGSNTQVKSFVSADDSYLYYSARSSSRGILWRMAISSGSNEWNQINNNTRYEWIGEIGTHNIIMIGYDVYYSRIIFQSSNISGKE